MRRIAAERETGLVMAGAAGLAVVSGLAVTRGGAAVTAGLLAVVIGFAVALVDWRLSVLGLLLYLPVSGLLTLAMYPNTGPGSVAKDLVFVIPAYLGYAMQRLAVRRRVVVPGLPALAIVALAALVLVQMLNPSVPNALVALIGAKTWLLYIPLAVLGYELVGNRAELDRVLIVLAAGAVVPCAIGISEAVLVYTGHTSMVFGWYGAAAYSATQAFGVFSVGSAQLHRIPSTFTSVTQFYSFTAAMAAVSYAAWRAVLAPRGRNVLGLCVVLLSVMAAMLSGARAGIVLVPGLLLAAALLDAGTAGRLRRVTGSAVTIGAGLALTAIVLGSGLRGLIGGVIVHGLDQFRMLFVDGIGHALSITSLGLGTGVDTVASRHVLPAGSAFQLVGGSWQESWWVKALLELGVAGLLALATLMGAVVVRAVRTTTALTDPGLRPVAAAITAFVLWCLVSSLKGQYLDIDPADVYFWLFFGILLRLPSLGATAEPNPKR